MIQLDVNLSTVLVWLGAILTIVGLAFSIISQVSAWRAAKLLDTLQRTVQNLNEGALSQLLDQQSRAFEANLKAPGEREIPGSPSIPEASSSSLAAESERPVAANGPQ